MHNIIIQPNGNIYYILLWSLYLAKLSNINEQSFSQSFSITVSLSDYSPSSVRYTAIAAYFIIFLSMSVLCIDILFLLKLHFLLLISSDSLLALPLFVLLSIWLFLLCANKGLTLFYASEFVSGFTTRIKSLRNDIFLGRSMSLYGCCLLSAISDQSNLLSVI